MYAGERARAVGAGGEGRGAEALSFSQCLSGTGRKDRHLSESVRTCVLKGADLILIPTANTKAEPLTMFEWEIRVQAMQNQVFIAMCNRVGGEGDMDFAGESLVVYPSGDVIIKADDREQLVRCELNLAEAREWREKVPYLGTRRLEWYL